MEYETKVVTMKNETKRNQTDIEKQIVTKKFQIIPKAVIHQEEETNFK